MRCECLNIAVVIPPSRAVPGELRTATAADVAWLADWHARFVADAGLSPAEAADARAHTASRSARGGARQGLRLGLASPP